MTVYALDFETWCELDLTVVGLDNYVSHPSFHVQLAALVDEFGRKYIFDFLQHGDSKQRLARRLGSNKIVAHNAAFEMAVLRRLYPSEEPFDVEDSAVIGRLMGGASKLADIAQQFLNKPKLGEEGRLVKKFALAPVAPTAADVQDDPDWLAYQQYCMRDAELALQLALRTYTELPSNYLQELERSSLTNDMNFVGWPVDMDAVRAMYQIYQDNIATAEHNFRSAVDAELNLNSFPQLKKWCADRGVNAKSFDQEHIATLYDAMRTKLTDMTLSDEKRQNYSQVAAMCKTKMIIGGTGLKKLQVILDTVSSDNRLRHQYMHVGAAQTLRTSSRGVQLQNLARIGTMIDMDALVADPDTWRYDNDLLGDNLRQVFCAQHPDGKLIVGDFSSVEARGLAFLAGDDKRLSMFRNGVDMYKAAAAEFFSISVADVTKEQRQFGKVAELSCGYGAGPDAVIAFAKKMGVEIKPSVAGQLVTTWRERNPLIPKFWRDLDKALRDALMAPGERVQLMGNGWSLNFTAHPERSSLQHEHPGSLTLLIQFVTHDTFKPNGACRWSRVVRGCYMRGKTVCYYKPIAKNGKTWTGSYTDAKTGRQEFYKLYGGKLSGIITQSLCREIFFDVMQNVADKMTHSNTKLIGQFHDELVLEWFPEGPYTDVEPVVADLRYWMTTVPRWLPSDFPLAAEVKFDRRYTK